MLSVPGEGERINLFSLVAYVPDPLGSFLDQLRRELVPECKLQTHATVLPPRPVFDDVEAAVGQIRSRMRGFSPFQIEVKDVEIFSLTSVVYLGIGAGYSELCRIHDALNNGVLQFCEPFEYHPHITLAQQLVPEQVPGVYEMARRRWAEFPDTRLFTVDALTFVQATVFNMWIDLEECAVGEVTASP